MPTASTPALRQAYASAPGGEDILATLELNHPLWPAPQYLTNAARAFTAPVAAGGAPITWLAFPFTLVLPTVDGAGQQTLEVTFTNADPLVRDLVELARQDPTRRITAVYREFLSDALDAGAQSAPLALSFDSIATSNEAVAGRANRSDVLNRRFPGLWYDVAHFPGLDR